MIHKHKTVIASLRNKQNVRVFIPEKLRIGGVSYVQPYKFIRVLPSAQPILVSMRAQLVIPISILINEVVVTSPFSVELIKSYLNQIVSVIDKSTTGVFRVLRQPRDGDVAPPVKPNPDDRPLAPSDPEDEPAPSDLGDEAYYRGQAKIDFE